MPKYGPESVKLRIQLLQQTQVSRVPGSACCIANAIRSLVDIDFFIRTLLFPLGPSLTSNHAETYHA
jgi:hypothetical protein